MVVNDPFYDSFLGKDVTNHKVTTILKSVLSSISHSFYFYSDEILAAHDPMTRKVRKMYKTVRAIRQETCLRGFVWKSFTSYSNSFAKTMQEGIQLNQ
jgi:predicted glycosyltransferase